MMFERHGLKVDGYSAIAPEDIAMFFQNYGIENNDASRVRLSMRSPTVYGKKICGGATAMVV
jgi:hypothetical protein